MTGTELDVRALPKSRKHPAVFAAFDGLAVGESLVLVNDHDPRHLRDEFETEHPGGHGWECVTKAPGEWRIRISRLASTPLPRVLTDTRPAGAGSPAGTTGAAGPGGAAGEPDAAGAVWRLRMRDRDLDSNIIQLPPGAGIEPHAGPDLDVLVHVLGGDGRLTTEVGTVDLAPGALVWLPRRSLRGFTAGADGLRYLTVHQRRTALVLEPPSARG